MSQILNKGKLFFTDYKIASPMAYKLAFFTTAALCTIIVGIEIIFSPPESTFWPMLPFWAMSVGLALCSLRWQTPLLGNALVALVFWAIQAVLYSNPKLFHIIVFWLPCVVILAVVVRGIRSASIWLLAIWAIMLFNGWQISHIVGQGYMQNIGIQSAVLSGLVFSLALLSSTFLLYILLGNEYAKKKAKSEELEKIKNKLEEQTHFLQKFQKELIGLSHNPNIANEGIAYLFGQMCAIAAEQLQVSRVSIWLFERNSLERRYLYELDQARGSSELVRLEREQCPNYFSALENRSFILADNAWNNPYTSEFAENYLKPLSIYSMLDCPIVANQKTIGVICCEEQGHFRTWRYEETLFLQSLANLVALKYKNKQIGELLQRISQQNTEITEKNQEITAMNEELIAFNENLETLVAKRTQELEKQNEQLSEYAFINSHLLRAPLSRVLGLANLLTYEQTPIQDRQLIDALQHASQELDSIVRTISDTLYQGKHLERKDLDHIVRRFQQGGPKNFIE